jgi:hypothetical protein
MIAIMNTPVSENPADGERMVAERDRNFHQKFGIPQALSRQSRFLTFESISDLAVEHDLRARIHRTANSKEIRARFGARYCTVGSMISCLRRRQRTSGDNDLLLSGCFGLEGQ